MKPTLLALPAAMLFAGLAWAQTPETDAVKKDGDPAVVGSPANPEEGSDTAAEARTVTPTPVVAPTSPSGTAAGPGTPAPTRLYTGTGVSTTTSVVSNGPVPDTPENRAKYGGPRSNAGKRTAPAGN